MLDTNIFNAILDGHLNLSQLENVQIFCTHVQLRELNATPNESRRDGLLEIFNLVSPTNVPTHTAIWDDTPWDQSRWSVDDGKYESLLKRITELDELRGKKSSEINRSRDARIAETALAEGFILLTNDRSLQAAVEDHGGKTKSSSELTVGEKLIDTP